MAAGLPHEDIWLGWLQQAKDDCVDWRASQVMQRRFEVEHERRTQQHKKAGLPTEPILCSIVLNAFHDILRRSCKCKRMQKRSSPLSVREE